MKWPYQTEICYVRGEDVTSPLSLFHERLRYSMLDKEIVMHDVVVVVVVVIA